MWSRKRVIRFCETYTEPIHVIFGLLSGLIVYKFFPEEEIDFIILVSILGAILPDIDHIFSIFVYNRKTDYAKTVKNFFRKKEYRNIVTFMKNNHKKNTGNYTHNIVTLLFVFILALVFLFYYHSVSWGAFFLAWTSHYVWDILEDLIFFSKLNPNWVLKFNKFTEKLKF